MTKSDPAAAPSGTKLRHPIRRGELVLGLVLLAVAAGLVAGAFTFPTGTMRRPGPAIFPFFIGVGLLLSVGWMLAGKVRPDVRPEDAEDGDGVRDRPAAVSLMALIGLALLFEPLGALVSIALFVFAMTLALGCCRIGGAILAAVLFAAAFHLFFVSLLNVQLPPGDLFRGLLLGSG